MKIAHIVGADTGGAAAAAYRLHRSMLAADMQSSFHAARLSGAWEGVSLMSQTNLEQPFLRRNTARLLRTALRRTCKGESDIQLQWRDQGFLKNVAETHDLLHLHWVDGELASVFEISELTKPIIWTLHDMRAFTGGHYYMGHGKSDGESVQYDTSEMAANPIVRLNQFVKRHILGRKRIHAIAPSLWMKREAEKSRIFDDAHLHHVPYGIAPVRDILAMRCTQRETHGLSNQDRVLLYGADAVGYPRKGHDLLMEALTAVQMNTPGRNQPWFFTFGKGTFTAPAGFSERHRHFGHVTSEEQMNQLYSVADVFVAPSREDNLPNVVLESLRCGTPVVAFNIGGMPDMIEHGVNGRLARPFNTIELGQAIHDLLNDPHTVHDEQRLEWSCKVLSDFSLDKQLKAMKEVYLAATTV